MKIIGLNGSHRSVSSTSYMLGEALEICEKRGFEVAQFDLSQMDLKFCTVCNKCKNNFTCSIDDDCFDLINEIIKADAIIVGTPTYYGNVSSRLKTFFDRTLPVRRNGMLLASKLGAALAVGGSRNGGQEKTIQSIHDWMLINQMTVVGDKETAHFGGICLGHNQEDIAKDDVGMKTVKNTAENICDILEKIKG